MRLPAFVVAFAFGLLLISIQAQANPERSGSVYYLPLTPGFVTNYGGPGRLKYLKADVTLELGEARAYQAAEQHLPLIRNVIVMNLARQSENNVITPRGQERIRSELKDALNRALKEEVGAEIVQDVLLTSFIFQN